MATSPQISVIVPHYNDLARLDICLTALENQTFTAERFEIIVADNRSPAGADALAAVIRDRARLVDAPVPGAGPARNAGVQNAKADILAFTDCDCIPDPAWLEQGLAALKAADFVGGRMKVLIPADHPMTGAQAFEAVFAFNNRSYVEDKHFTVTANLFCPRKIFEAVGPFRTEVSEDKEWCLRARDHGYRIGYASEAIVSHPARANWPELRDKWARLNSESFALITQHGGGRLLWLLRTWALLPSILFHGVKVLRSDVLSGASIRISVLGILTRLRLWRFVYGHRLLLRKRRRGQG